MGKLEFKSILPGGAVMISRNGTFVSWGCLKATVNGKLLFDINGPESMVISYDGNSVVAANGMSEDFAAAKVELNISSVNLKGQAVTRPEDKSFGVNVKSGKCSINVPANKVIYVK